MYFCHRSLPIVSHCLNKSLFFLKVRQYIHSVNGQYVLMMDHKAVGKLIMQSVNHVTLEVMTHKRDAAM